jgi:hypothetical protein
MGSATPWTRAAEGRVPAQYVRASTSAPAVMVGSSARYYNVDGMKLPGPARRRARVASLVAVAVVLCLATLPTGPPTGSGVSAALAISHSSHVDQRATGNGQPMDWSYSALPTEETENVAKDPVNTDLLTALLLVSFFVATIRWLLANGHREFRFRDAARHPSFVTAREAAPFLVVFRL